MSSRRWESSSERYNTYSGRNNGRNNSSENRNYQRRNTEGENSFYQRRSTNGENKNYQRRSTDGENRNYQRRNTDYENRSYQRRNTDGESRNYQRRNTDGENRNYQRRNTDDQSQKRNYGDDDGPWEYHVIRVPCEDWNDSNAETTWIEKTVRRRVKPGLVIYVYYDKVRKIIGKGGSQIKALEAESNAKIIIEKLDNEIHPEHVGETPIRLVGTEEAQQKAKTLIEELLSRNEYSDLILDGEEARKYREEKERREQMAEKDDQIDWAKANREAEEYQRNKWAHLPPIIKNFYEEDPTVAKLTSWQVKEIRKNNNNIEVDRICDEDETPADMPKIPNPIETFEQAFQHYPDILTEIRKQGFVKPSPIQCQAWPVLLSGQDLIGIAQTGTGKTLAFLLPALIHIDGQTTPRNERNGPNVLILAPTRELALQIEKEVNKYSYHDIKAVCVYGGGNLKEQINSVTKGVQIVIATPGRLNDLLKKEVLNLTSVTFLVLDEADRMLDMGFEPQIRLAMIDIRPDRQTVMTSATWPEGVRRLVKKYTKNPVQVYVGSLDLAAVHTVTQTVHIITEEEKENLMYQFIRNMSPDEKVLIFLGRKARVDHVASELACNSIDCDSIHGDREQADREQALADLASGKIRILLATDVASRGLDIEDITHVLNYDFPRDIEEYVHRVGRTGRAGRTGESITFMTRSDWSHAEELIKILEEANQAVPDELYSMAERYQAWKEKKGSQFRGRSRYGNRY